MSRRLFVAVEPSTACRALAARAASALQERFPELRARWQPTENLHLTLAFLGQVPEEDVVACADRLSELAAGARPFGLASYRLGAFPSARRPSVLWLGVRADPAAALGELQRDVATSYRQLHDDRKPFRPHLTLGRVKDLGATPRAELATTLTELPPDTVRWTVREVVLFESRLAPAGAVHTPIRTGTLGG